MFHLVILAHDAFSLNGNFFASIRYFRYNNADIFGVQVPIFSVFAGQRP